MVFLGFGLSYVNDNDDVTDRQFQDCHAIFLKRDLRECFVSLMRSQTVTARDRGAWTRIDDPQKRLLAYMSKWGRSFAMRARAIAGWAHHADQVLTFDDLNDPAATQRLAKALTAPFDERAIARARRAPSLTRLHHPRPDDPWSEQAERRFTALTNCSVVAEGGYSEPSN